MSHKRTIVTRTVGMDGFGRQGDVANGSFEHAAPFGGFGWRYFEDGAVTLNAVLQITRILHGHLISQTKSF